MGEYNAQTYSLQKGLLKFKESGKQAAVKEKLQSHNGQVFEPILLQELSERARRNSLIFLTEKRDGSIIV